MIKRERKEVREGGREERREEGGKGKIDVLLHRKYHAEYALLTCLCN